MCRIPPRRNKDSSRRGPIFPHPCSQCSRTPCSPVWYGANTAPSTWRNRTHRPGRSWTSPDSTNAGAADDADGHGYCFCCHRRHRCRRRHHLLQRTKSEECPRRAQGRHRKVQHGEEDMCWTVDHPPPPPQRHRASTTHPQMIRRRRSSEDSATSIPPPGPVQSQPGHRFRRDYFSWRCCCCCLLSYRFGSDRTTPRAPNKTAPDDFGTPDCPSRTDARRLVLVRFQIPSCQACSCLPLVLVVVVVFELAAEGRARRPMLLE